MLPMLAELNDLRERAASLGLIVTKEEADAADDLGDRFDTLGAVWDRLKTKAGASFAPVMARALDALTSMVLTLVRSLDAVGHAMTIIGAGLASIGDQFEEMILRITGTLADGLAAIERMTGIEMGDSAVRGLGKVAGVGAAGLFGGRGAASRLPPGMEQQYNDMIRAATGGAFGTFSSPGSSLAGRAGKGIGKDNEISETLNKILEKLGVEIDAIGKVENAVEDLELGFQ